MKILIIGAGGMVGQKLVQRLLDPDFNSFNVKDIVVFDLCLPNYKDSRVSCITGNLSLIHI